MQTILGASGQVQVACPCSKTTRSPYKRGFSASADGCAIII
ncbi:hypothetical protein [Dryocola sp. BD613]